MKPQDVRISAHILPGLSVTTSALPLRLRFLAMLPRLWRHRLPMAGLVVGVLLALIVIDRIAIHATRTIVLEDIREEAAAAADLRVAMLRSEIEKQRTLPVVLAQDPDVHRALMDPTGNAAPALNAKLEALAAATRASVIYLMTPQGHTIAASNHRLASSFVGSNYSFRPYFQRAMQEGQAEHFALGTVSHQPGLYLAQKVSDKGRVLGVIVVKTEFHGVEADWRRQNEPTFITDDRDIVLVSSVPQWRFHTTRPIPAEQKAALRTSLQFGDAPLNLLPITARPDDTVEATVPPARNARTFMDVRTGIPTTSWTLHVLAPVAPTLPLAEATIHVLILLGGVLFLGGGAVYLGRRQRLSHERRRGQLARRHLEARVESRTAELQVANAQLRTEMAARRSAREAADALQDELVQASKLAMLGQIAASVAHEVNQPVAAIRAFSDNAQTFLQRGHAQAAQENLQTIGALTERIGAITSELRAFSRKAPREVSTVSVQEVMDGALLLVGHRLRLQNVALTVNMPAQPLRVKSDRIRLEQVLVNLFQNAMEALANQQDARITLTAQALGTEVRITFADNGPGLSAAVLDALFTPFTTTKPTGLGLGLVICHDIIAECGGRLEARNEGGAIFTMILPGAE